MGRKGEHDESAIWVSRNGNPAVQFTSGLTADTTPVFSPDSGRLAFLSDRHERGKYRVYVMPLAGGEAQRVGTVEGELENLQWSPDGRHLGVLAKDPETEAEKKAKEEHNDPILEEQQLKFARLWVIDVSSGTSRQLTYGKRNVMEFTFSLDGSHVAVTTSPRTDVEAEFQMCELGVISVGGGRTVKIAETRGITSPLVFVRTSDGEKIAARFNGFFDDPVDSIWLFPTEPGSGRELLTDDHGNVEAIYPIPGKEDSLGLRMVDGVHGNAMIVSAETGERTYALPTDWINRGTVMSGPAFSTNARDVAFVWSDSVTPEEVYLSARGATPVRLTTFGASFEGRLNRTELVEWQSDEWTIQGHLIYPHGYEEGKRYPLLIEPHGGPSWQWEDHCFLDWHDWAQYMASRGFAVLAPNPRGSTGRGQAFQRALQHDVGGGEVRDLIAGAQAMVDRGIADPERLGIGGWSWGGYLTATTITKTTMFKAAMMGAGLSNLYSDHGTDDIPSANLLYFPGEPYHHSDMYWEGSALKRIVDCKTPTLVIHGDADERVHPLQGREMFRALTRLGIDTEFVRYPRQGHTIKERNYQIDLLTRLGDWFEKYLN